MKLAADTDDPTVSKNQSKSGFICPSVQHLSSKCPAIIPLKNKCFVNTKLLIGQMDTYFPKVLYREELVHMYI